MSNAPSRKHMLECVANAETWAQQEFNRRTNIVESGIRSIRLINQLEAEKNLIDNERRVLSRAMSRHCCGRLSASYHPLISQSLKISVGWRHEIKLAFDFMNERSLMNGPAARLAYYGDNPEKCGEGSINWLQLRHIWTLTWRGGYSQLIKWWLICAPDGWINAVLMTNASFPRSQVPASRASRR